MLGQVVYKNELTAINGKFDEQVSLTGMTGGMYLMNMHTGTEIKYCICYRITEA